MEVNVKKFMIYMYVLYVWMYVCMLGTSTR